jgi:hypothetical protein
VIDIASPGVASSMAQLIRSAKSGSDWSRQALLAYNITINVQTSAQFFGREPDAPLDNLDQDFISYCFGADDDQTSISDHTLRLIQYLDLATRANAGQESAIDDFAKELLRLLGFEERGLLLRSRYAIPLTISGDSSRRAQTDICLVHGNTTILPLLQEDKTAISAKDPEPQIVAGAIAAFQYNNRQHQSKNLQPLDIMTIPCIAMIGTRPIFYKIPVTTALSDAVASALYPVNLTRVDRCAVSSRRASEGMEVPRYRQKALQHLITFKDLAKSLWPEFYV